MSPSYRASLPAPPTRSLWPLAVAAMLLGASSSAAAVDLFLPGKDDRPAGLASDYRSGDVPCDQPVLEILLSPAQADTLDGATAGASAVGAYGCQPGWALTGPEDLYVLTVDEDLILDAWLTDNVPDHDLILLSACHTDSCLVQANTELSATLRAGRTYYLLVDGYLGAAGGYSLILATRHIGLAPSICADGGAVPLDIAAAGSEILPGNLAGAPNLVSIDDCSQLAWPGGEAWYALHLAAAEDEGGQSGHGAHLRVDVTATTAIGSLDLALWLFDGCGPDAVCLAFADLGNAGQSETLGWQNEAPEPVTVYLGVDCRRPPDAELFGAFELEVGTTVAVRPRSLSGVRGLFR